MLTKRNSLPIWTFILLTSIVYFMPSKAFAASSNLPALASEITFEHAPYRENKVEIKQTNKQELVARYRRRSSRRRPKPKSCETYSCLYGVN